MRRKTKSAAPAVFLLFFMAVTVFFAANAAKNEGSVVEMTEFAQKALILTGCDMERFDASNPRLSEQVVIDSANYLAAVLAKKYPDASFELQACIKAGPMQPYDEFLLAETGDAEKCFTARVYGGSDGYSSTDAYYGVANAAIFENYLKSVIVAVEPDAAVYADIDMQCPEDITLETPLEQVMQDKGFFPFTWILLPPGSESFETRFDRVKRDVEAASVPGDFTVFLMEADARIETKADARAFIPKNENEQGLPVYAAVNRFSYR